MSEDLKLHNNNKLRRFRKALKSSGPSGAADPFGNRAYRRSKEGKARIALMMDDLRQKMLAVAKDN